MTPTAGILARTSLVVCVVVLAIFYLRLGWFLILIWPLGAALALWVSRREIRAHYSRVLAVAIALVAYVATAIGLWQTLVGRESTEVFGMAWLSKGDRGESREAEIVLEFERFPGRYVGMYSNRLRDHLQAAQRRSVEVEFVVTRDFGCTRGFHVTRVGEFTAMRSVRGGYSGQVGVGGVSPFGEAPWWCP